MHFDSCHNDVHFFKKKDLLNWHILRLNLTCIMEENKQYFQQDMFYFILFLFYSIFNASNTKNVQFRSNALVIEQKKIRLSILRFVWEKWYWKKTLFNNMTEAISKEKKNIPNSRTLNSYGCLLLITMRSSLETNKWEWPG